VLFVPLVLATMSQQDLVAALRWFRVPYVLCFIIALSLRTIPMLERDVTLIRDAQRSRGIDLDRGGLVARARLLGTVVLPLMTVSIVRLEVLSRVIESRGVARRGPRSFYRPPHPTAMDRLLMVGSVLLIAGIFGAKMTPAGAVLLG
jgi:energy-coupling factor transport system permease protein